ncbi:MAG: hypothetical protein M0D57_10420 [Sphingobacteriales bacterium JAD_PAG50586_3]|nr:MAG: hypothetical protein M0D57_10420 [Sphingobacteriales bacterium JAD_PAG50586_3]
MKKFAVLFTLLILAISLSAQTSRTWTGSTSTDWNTDSNWSPSGVPSSSDHIVLNNGSLTNMPLLDASYSINNITVSAGTLDLNGYTLTITGTTSLTGGNINNGTATFSNNTTTIAGTNCGAKVNITANTVTLNTSTFNKKVVIIKNGNSADYWASGTFNDTLDIHNSSTSGSLMVGSNYTLNLNENVWISNSSSGSITFGHNSNGGKTVLASGKKIQIGSGALLQAH